MVKGDYPYIHGRIKWFRGQRFCNIQFILFSDNGKDEEGGEKLVNMNNKNLLIDTDGQALNIDEERVINRPKVPEPP